MFRLTRKPSSGSHSQYLAKITHLVKSGYVELVQYVISVMAAYYDLLGVCTVHCVRVCTLTQYTVHTPHRSQYAAITLITSCTSSNLEIVIILTYNLLTPNNRALGT